MLPLMDVAVKVNEVGHRDDERPVVGLRGGGTAAGRFRFRCAPRRVEGFVAVGRGPGAEALEPQVRMRTILESPQTGIVDAAGMLGNIEVTRSVTWRG